MGNELVHIIFYCKKLIYFSPFYCLCKSKNCFGYIQGFKFLEEEKKKNLEPFLTPYIKKMWKDTIF